MRLQFVEFRYSVSWFCNSTDSCEWNFHWKVKHWISRFSSIRGIRWQWHVNLCLQTSNRGSKPSKRAFKALFPWVIDWQDCLQRHLTLYTYIAAQNWSNWILTSKLSFSEPVSVFVWDIYCCRKKTLAKKANMLRRHYKTKRVLFWGVKLIWSNLVKYVLISFIILTK